MKWKVKLNATAKGAGGSVHFTFDSKAPGHGTYKANATAAGIDRKCRLDFSLSAKDDFEWQEDPTIFAARCRFNDLTPNTLMEDMLPDSSKDSSKDMDFIVRDISEKAVLCSLSTREPTFTTSLFQTCKLPNFQGVLETLESQGDPEKQEWRKRDVPVVMKIELTADCSTPAASVGKGQ